MSTESVPMSTPDREQLVMACQACTPRRLCVDCRVAHIRQLARERQRRRRAVVHYVDEHPPLLAMMLFHTERAEWIEMVLKAQDQTRQQQPRWRPDAQVRAVRESRC